MHNSKTKLAKDVYSPCKCMGKAKIFVLVYEGEGRGRAHAYILIYVGREPPNPIRGDLYNHSVEGDIDMHGTTW